MHVNELPRLCSATVQFISFEQSNRHQTCHECRECVQTMTQELNPEEYEGEEAVLSEAHHSDFSKSQVNSQPILEVKMVASLNRKHKLRSATKKLCEMIGEGRLGAVTCVVCVVFMSSMSRC